MNTSKKAVLSFRTVGTCFGTEARLTSGKEILWESRVLPLGFFSAGREMAKEFAAKNNIVIVKGLA